MINRDLCDTWGRISKQQRLIFPVRSPRQLKRRKKRTIRSTLCVFRARRLLEKKSDFRGHPCARDSNDSAPRVGKTRSLRQDSRRRIFRRFSVIILPKEGEEKNKLEEMSTIREREREERGGGKRAQHWHWLSFRGWKEDRWKRRRREDAGRWCWPWRRRNGGLRTGT